MDRRDRKRIASPTIEEVLLEYLADERRRLANSTFRRYEEIIGLFVHSLNGYAYQNLERGEAGLFKRLFDAEGEDHREFTEIFGPDHILDNVCEFLEYFMPRKVMCGKDLLRASGTVTKKLANWLLSRGYVGMDDAEFAAEQGATAARDLPATQDLARLLREHAASAQVFAETKEGYFLFAKSEDGRVLLEDFDVFETGPLELPEDVAVLCREGWALSGVIGRRGRRWYIADVYNVYTGL